MISFYLEIDPCYGYQCDHGGKCIEDPPGVPKCLCPVGTSGPHCDNCKLSWFLFCKCQ